MTDLPMFVFIFSFGLIFGSFFNVCISRIPKARSIVFPSSFCPKCKMQIPFYWNIPLLSYLLLGGKCAKCKRPISFLYPGVEFLSGCLALALFLHLTPHQTPENWLRFIIFYGFFGSLLISSFIDIRYFIIPDRFTLGGIFFGILISTLYPALHHFSQSSQGFIHSSVSALLCYAVLNSVRLLGKLWYKREAMGYGDVKLMGAFGAFLGVKLALFSLFLGALMGALLGILLMLLSNKDTKSEIPFGPYLALGALLSFLRGEELLSWYTQFF